MKKRNGKRVLAGFLAVLLVLTSFAWDFGGANVAEASGTTNELNPADGYFNFEGVDIADLATDFTASKQLKNNAFELTNKAPAELWYTGKSCAATNQTSTHTGLKAKLTGENTHYIYLYRNKAYQNFKATIELRTDGNIGFSIGDQNQGISNTTSTVTVWFPNQSFAVAGAVDWNEYTCTVNGSSATLSTGNTTNVNYKASSPSAGTLTTVDIEVKDGYLTIIAGYTTLKVKLKSTFAEDCYVGLWNANYLTNYKGGFKSLAIYDLDKDAFMNFDKAAVADLTADFTASKYDKQTGQNKFTDTNKTPAELWYTGEACEETSQTSNNTGLKAKLTGSNTHYMHLYHDVAYSEYKATVELRKQGNIGITLGNKDKAIGNTDTSIAAWVPNATVAINGALDWSDYTYIENGVEKQTESTGNQRSIKYIDTAPSDGTLVTMDIIVKAGYLNLSVGYSTLRVKLASTFPKESHLGLWNANYPTNNGGFKSLYLYEYEKEGFTRFDGKNVSDLATDFTASKYDKQTGQNKFTDTNKTPAELWYTGKTCEETSQTSQNRGLKAKLTGDNTHYMYLYRNETYVDYKATIELRTYGNIGFVIGDKNQGISNTSTAIHVWFPNHSFAVAGAVDWSDYTYTANGSSATLTTGNTTNVVYRSGSPTAGTLTTVNVEVKEGYLTVSVGYAVLKVKIKDTFPLNSQIGLWNANYPTNNGGFKSLYVEEIAREGFIGFDGANIDDLATNFTASKYVKNAAGFEDANKEQLPSAYWYTGTSSTNPSQTSTNTGLKAKAVDGTGDKNYMFLYHKETYENYKATVELRKRSSSSNMGFVLGDKHELISNTKYQVAAWLNTSGQIAIQGAVDWSKCNLVINGEDPITSVTAGNNNLYTFKYAASEPKEGTVIPIDIEVADGYLTVEIGYSTLTVKLQSTFPTLSHVGLWCQDYITNHGGFRSLTVRELNLNTGTIVDQDGYTEFDHVDVAALEEAGFTSTRFTKPVGGTYTTTDADKNQPVSSHWFAGMASEDGTATSKNIGLKANTAGENYYTYLNTPYKYQDFSISTEVYWTGYAGIALGKGDVYPVGTADETSVRIYFNVNQIQLTGGGLDYDTAIVSGEGTWNTGNAPSYIFKPSTGFKGHAGDVFKLNVEMKSGVLTIWVDEYDGVLSVKTKDTFSQENIALMMRGYDGDSNSGGFKTLTVKEMNNVVQTYTAEQFAGYRTEGNYTAPEYKNYLFAGWYEDETCAKAVSAETKTVEGNVYAKFVPSYILDAKAQVSAHLRDDDFTDDTSGGIRFVTTVDSLRYSKIGFDISYDKGEGEKTISHSSDIVYKQLYATIGNTDDSGKTTIEYKPTDYCNASEYFKACTIKSIPYTLYDMEFKVTPFWITLDGTKEIGKTIIRTIDMGIPAKSTVYVGSTGTDDIGFGTEAAPYATLNYAIEQVADGGTVYVNDNLSYTGTQTVGDGIGFYLGGTEQADSTATNEKQVTITSTSKETQATLDFSANKFLLLNSAITLKNIHVKWADRVVAEGNRFIVESSVTQEGTKEPMVMGGSVFHEVDKTDIKLYSGTYKTIIGGSTKTVGETHVTVGGTVNSEIDATSHDHNYLLFGGSYTEGNVVTVNESNVKVESGAKFNYVYGGGGAAEDKTTSSTVNSTHVDFAGEAVGVYGGGYQIWTKEANKIKEGHIVVSSTDVKITGGTVQQVFGGNENASMTGNTKVELLGGTITRRVYGGCYNECDPGILSEDTWYTTYSVTGNTTVIIGAGVDLALTGTDQDVMAGSRGKDAFVNEVGTVIFLDGCYESKKDVLGSTYFGDTYAYKYLVKAGTNGTASVVGNELIVTPNTGYTATVTGLTAEEDGKYLLTGPEGQTVVEVTFSESAE